MYTIFVDGFDYPIFKCRMMTSGICLQLWSYSSEYSCKIILSYYYKPKMMFNFIFQLWHSYYAIRSFNIFLKKANKYEVISTIQMFLIVCYVLQIS